MSISRMKEGEVMGRGIAPTEQQLEAIKEARERDPETVAVLGAGPAGLLAAHAVELAGRQAVIFSEPHGDGLIHPSRIAGAIYLHTAIPDLTSGKPDAALTFRKLGTREGYAFKVYGSRFAPCSWDKFEEGTTPAWALQPVYDELWRRFLPKMVPSVIDGIVLSELIDTFPMVISTIPPHAYCAHVTDGIHTFPSRPIYIEQRAIPDVEGDPEILYDGRLGVPSGRYRSSRVFGQASTEYMNPPRAPHVIGKKLLATTCDCFADEVVRAGRWGCWTPGVLTHHAFEKVWSKMFDQFEGA